jgi:hypothetical protein
VERKCPGLHSNGRAMRMMRTLRMAYSVYRSGRRDGIEETFDIRKTLQSFKHNAKTI